MHAGQFDIIIDDGSHTSSDIILAFCRLFPYLKTDGLYIIEDLHCSYWKQFDGGLFNPASSISFFKVLIDILNFEHWGLELSREVVMTSFHIPRDVSTDFLADIHSIEFINSMCIINKKTSAHNSLGMRHIAGKCELVAPVLQVAGTFNEAPNQKKFTSINSDTNGEMLLEIALTELQTSKLKIAELQERIQSLESQHVAETAESKLNPR
jgi:hypothetical protein